MASTFVTLPLIPQPWANGGVHAVIPNATTGTNRASWTTGWDEITSTPIADGGIPPNRLDFNGMAYNLSAFAYAMQQGKYWTFDLDVSNAIGGYPLGAVLWVADTSGNPLYMVRSLIANNVNNFVSTPSYIDGVNWVKLSLDVFGDSMLGTLSDQSAAQVRNIQIVTEEPTTGVDGTIYAIIES